MANVNPTAASSGASEVPPTANIPATNPKMRKRTKTGCLTCRKRRIKCGEERPTCANCIKSKRQCEGYNQRVVFKPPIGDWPNHPGAVTSLQYHNSMLPGTRTSGYRPAQSAVQPQDNTLTSIQPRPITQFEYAVETGPTLAHLNTQAFVSNNQPYRQDPSYQQPLSSPHHQPPLHSPHHQIPTPTSAASYFPQPSPVHAVFQGQRTHETNAGYQESQQYLQNQFQHVPVTYDSHVDQKPSVSQASQEQDYHRHPLQTTTRPEEQNSFVPQTSTSSQAEEYPLQFTEHRPSIPRYPGQSQAPLQQPQATAADFSQAGSYTLSLAASQAVSHADSSSHSSFQPVQIPQHDVVSDVKHMHQHAVYGMSRV